LHCSDIDPFDVSVIVRPSAIGQSGRVLLDVSRLVVIFILMRQAIKVAKQLGKQAAAYFIFEFLSGYFNESPSISIGILEISVFSDKFALWC
jgi:hypothetical protein